MTKKTVFTAYKITTAIMKYLERTMKINSEIIIIGGGFAGARTAQDLVKAGFSNVTLIDRKDYFEVTYATLRGIVEPNKWGKSSRRKYQDFFNGSFLQASVIQLTREQLRLDTGAILNFDFVVIATGSSYPSFQIGKSADALDINQRHQQFKDENKKLVKAKEVLVIGGGPVGVELAGEIADYYPEKNVTLVQKSNRLLNGFRDKTSKTSEKLLEKLGVNVLLNETIRENEYGELVARTANQVIHADIIYSCVGVKVNTGWLDGIFNKALNSQGQLIVDEFLRVRPYNNIFAIGDCSNVKEAKLGNLANMQGKELAKNMVRLLKGKGFKEYKTNPDKVLLPTGRKSGLAQLPFAVTTAKLLVNMKQKDLFISKTFKDLGVKQTIHQD
ncbi:MAG: FAD-dependent oxidoreductase [Bermanella sp.]